jgi:hypothetical protein
MSFGRANAEDAVPSSSRVSGQPPRTWSPAPAAILALQRGAGNRAVGRLMRKPRAPARRRNPRTIVLTVTPGHKMSGRELALLALRQIYGDTEDEAKTRLEEWESRGGGAVQGRFASGVDQDEAKNPIKVAVILPPLEQGLAEDMHARAQDLAALPVDAQKPINDEADRRFWKKLGDESHGKLGRGRDEQGKRELWMQTRDEVLKERERLLGLPDAARDFLSPSGEEITPENYEQAIRIAEKAGEFTSGDWARYERNAMSTTDDLSVVEDSIERFAKRRAKEQAIAERVKHTEHLFELWHRQRASFPPGEQQRLADEYLRMNPSLGFKTMADYDAACRDYLLVFRDHAVEIAFAALRASEAIVRSELARYADPAGIATTFADLGPMRDIVDKAADDLARLNEEADEENSSQGETTRDQGEKDIQSMLRADTEAERKRQTARHPIFGDPELKTGDLSKRDPQALANILRSDAQDRLHDIDKTRARLVRDPEAVFQADRIVAATLKEMGAQNDNIYEQIVRRHQFDIRWDHTFRAIAMTVLAIGFGIMTFGTGAVAVVAAGALLAQGVYTAAEELKRYGDAYSAAHTAFDANQTLSSDSPSAFWAAFALLAVGLDAAILVNTLKTVARPLSLLEETGSLKKFGTELDGIEDLAPELKIVLKRALKARPELDAAVRSLRRALKRAERAGAGIADAQVLAEMSKAGQLGAQLGMKSFDEFVAFLKASSTRPIDLSKLSADELAAVKTAWEGGVHEAERAGVAVQRTGAGGGGDPAASKPPARDTGEPGQPGRQSEPGEPGSGGGTAPPPLSPIGQAVADALRPLASARPSEWPKLLAALARAGGKNSEIAKLLPTVMDGLCNPRLYGEVLAEAVKRAGPKGDLQAALMEIAAESGLPTQVIQKGQGLVEPAEFFRRYASREAYFVDLPLEGDPHGSLTHLIQDLVVDRAFQEANISMRSPKFRALLREAEGVVTRAEYGTADAMTFLDPPLVKVAETEMATGDYVWRFTYDLILRGHMPQPENMWPLIKLALGIM